MKMKNSNYQQGFTWIEAVMIIAILLILGSIAIPRFYNFQNQTTPNALTPAETNSTKTLE